MTKVKVLVKEDGVKAWKTLYKESDTYQIGHGRDISTTREYMVIDEATMVRAVPHEDTGQRAILEFVLGVRPKVRPTCTTKSA